MEYIEVPEFPVLRGEEAVRALQDFVKELEGSRGKALTKKQATTLIKIASGLIATIEEEVAFNPKASGSHRAASHSSLEKLFMFLKRHRT